MKRIMKLCMLAGLVIVALSACTGGSSSELDDTAWQILTIEGEPTVDGARVQTIQFEAGGDVSGLTGCNGFWGNYMVRGSTIRISQVWQTAMACFEGQVMNQEELYLDILRSARRYELRDGLLIVEDGQGRTLIFEPR